MAQAKDVFPNLAAARTLLSAANTLTFTQVLTGVNLGAGVGMLIDKVQFYPDNASIGLMADDSDELMFAITTSNLLTDLTTMTDRRILLMKRILGNLVGVAANFEHYELPFEMSFTPPLIFASPQLFIAGDSTGLAAPMTFDTRLYFRYITLTAQEYIELAEQFILLG